MKFDFIDNYLLEGLPAKEDTIRQILETPVPLPAATPFYRALQALGARVADEAIMALRLVLAGKQPTDERVKRLRDAAASGARAEYQRELL